ncbi:hypothetical protein SAMN04487977_101448 [Treponema bryantii]|uniref:Uncharacterized protein n=1 Tax=Treponema bryantii TaxID=163 RepID=A0A1H9AS12_9SPIR|nr:hypothetical protein [Treponema bryantii]SEP79510.1 hypothetical protein SAMN04487977_101448 [Treponema bryantii]
MNGEVLTNVIGTVIYLLPVLALVWKGAKLTSKLEQLEKDVEEKTSKFCNDHKTLQAKIEEERKSTDKSIDAIMLTLTDIQKSLVRVETKLEEKEKK